MIGRLVVVCWLAGVWVALWGELTIQNAAVGGAIGALLVLVFPLDRPFRPPIRPVAVVRLGVVFAWRLTVASAIVAWEVVTPRNRIHEGVVAVDIRSDTDVLIALVANVVSLTPGTLTLDVDRDRRILYVHVLHLHDVDAVRRSVRELDDLVIRAFGTTATVAALDVGTDSPSLGEDPR